MGLSYLISVVPRHANRLLCDVDLKVALNLHQTKRMHCNNVFQVLGFQSTTETLFLVL